MKKGILFFLVFFMVFNLRAQTISADNKQDHANNTTTLITNTTVFYLTEKEYDFGKIIQGKPVTHVFTVVNKGNDSLKILDIQASCGCTTPSWEKNKVQAPGEKTSITVGFNAAAEGPFTKSISVSYNNNQMAQMIIKGEVWSAPVTSAPENNTLENLKNL